MSDLPAPSPSTPSQLESAVARLALLGLWVVAAAGAALQHASFRDYVFEDTYITFRYARNVAEGAGYVFTPGERVFGATAPLHTLLLAACGFLGFDVPVAAGVVFALALGAIGLLGGLVLRRLGAPLAAVLYCAFAVSGATRIYAYWGMETPLLVALVLGALLAALRGRDTLAGLLAGLAFLIRYDAALFALLLFAALRLRRGRIPWRPGLAAAAVALPWLLFAQLYFGSVLPNTLNAKQGEMATWPYLLESARLQLNLLWKPLLEEDGPIFRVSTASVVLSAALGVLALLGLWRAARREPLALLLAAYALALWIGYGVIGPPVQFTWYLTPAAFALALLGCAGLGALAAPLPRRAWTAVTGLLLVVGVVGVAGAEAPARLRRLDALITEGAHHVGRVVAYERIAEWIVATGLTNETLLSNEPGYLTFLTRNPAIDAAGLVTRDVFMHGDPERRTGYGSLARRFRPGLAVTQLPGRIPGYVPAFHAYPYRYVLLREDLHAQAFERLRESFLSTATRPGEPAPVGHPLAWDVDRDTLSRWTELGGEYDRRAGNDALLVDGERYHGATLTVREPWTGAQTPSFRIDFDRLEFRFAGTHPRHTLAQLVVNGVVVLQQGGRRTRADAPPGREFGVTAWNVRPWRGRTARLRLVHVGAAGRDWISVDEVRSVRDAEELRIDDFESGSAGSGDGPTDLRSLAPRLGVELLDCGRAATTHGRQGEREWSSRPFVVERDRLGFLMLDHGQRKDVSVELHVDGQAVRRVRGAEGRHLRPVTWSVREFRGRTAVLVVRDAGVRVGDWVGIDELRQFD